MKFRALIVCLVLSISFVAIAQTKPNPKPAASNSNGPGRSASTSTIDPAKEADIRKLLQVSGAMNLAIQMMDAMEESIKPMMTRSLPEGAYRAQLVDLFFEKFHQRRDVNRLVDLAVPIYDKYYTAEEVKGLLQFYSSPLGQKAVATVPKVTAEMQQIGGKWGEQLGRDCMTEVLTEHPDLEKQLEDAAKAGKGN